MIVGLDARKLWDGGIGTYIRGLAAAMSERPRGHELVALLGPEDRGRFAWGGPVREVEVRAGHYGVREHWAVPAAARRARVSLLHAPHYILPLGWSGPSVVTSHDLIHVRFAHFFPPGAALYARAMAGAAARRARAVIVNSSHTARDVIELLGVPPPKVQVIPLGPTPGLSRPDPASVEAFRRARALPSAFVLYMGARKPHKNLPLLLESLARIPAADRPALVLSGAAWSPTGALGALARRLGLEAGLHFAGDLRDPQDLARLYAAATLYVQPSLTEGFGLPPLEAMACGTAVLSSTGGALPETVGDAAETLPPEDADRWAAAIRALLADPARRAEWVRRGLERAAAFTWRGAAESTLDLYERVMGEGGSRLNARWRPETPARTS